MRFVVDERNHRQATRLPYPMSSSLPYASSIEAIALRGRLL